MPSYLPKGTILHDTYQIIRYISSGGFGITYEAENIIFHERVAIKEFFVKDFCNRDEETSHVTIGINSKTALVEKLKKKFKDEAIAIRELKSENINIVSIEDFFEENDTAYYVMNYIEGLSLNELIKKEGKIETEKARKYILQVANALKVVHSKNRLHLDIKPGNIMIDGHDNAILIDFGASKQYEVENGENTSTLIGITPGYAPIEQMSRKVQKFTPATDIYALGATLYKMVTGVTPNDAATRVSDKILSPQPNDKVLCKAIEAAMEIRKEDRPQTMEDFIALLNTEKTDELTKEEIHQADKTKNGKEDKHINSDDDSEETLVISAEEERLKTLIKKAEEGDVASQIRLGDNYYYGINGVKQDIAKAIDFWTRAASQGNNVGEYKLGIFYYNNKNRALAKTWLEKSASKGNPAARKFLDIYYGSGGVPESEGSDALKEFGFIVIILGVSFCIISFLFKCNNDNSYQPSYPAADTDTIVWEDTMLCDTTYADTVGFEYYE